MNTEQERAWAGELGNAYNRRSPGNEEANYHCFNRALWSLEQNNIRTILELGAGQGANLRALRRLRPQAEMTALELNLRAAEVLAHTSGCSRVISASVLDWEPDRAWDLVLTKGLLIHIHPEHLCVAYEVIHRAAARWILMCEYYSPSPQMIPYRGEEDRLWKRDFAGEMLDRYKDLRLVEYGFWYHRDASPQDDVTWFLLEKKQQRPESAIAAWPFAAGSRS